MSPTAVTTLPTDRVGPPTPEPEPPLPTNPRRLRVVGIVGGILLVVVLIVVAAFVLPSWFGSGVKTLTLHGVVEVQEVRLGSKVGGRVAEVLAREGERVRAGTPLVRLDLPELQAQRDLQEAKVAQAIAEREKARAGPRPQEIEQARAAMESAEAKLLELRNGPRVEEIAQARADLAASEADAQLRQRELNRHQNLIGTGGTTPGDLDQARSAYQRAVALTNSARAKLDLLKNGTRPEEIAQAVAERDRLKAQYDLLKAGTRKEDLDVARAQVEQARAQLKNLDAQLAEGLIKAEEPCLVEVIGVRKGDLVAPNQAMVRVLRAEDLWVRIYIPEPDLGKVRLGQPARVSLDAYPGIEFSGQVMQIENSSEFTPRNVQSKEQRKHQVFAAKVRVDDPRGVFKSGLAAEVVLPLYGADQ